MSRRRKIQFDLRFMLLMLTIVSASTWWWVSWPQRTWRRFVRAVSEGDLDGANRLCDAGSIRFENVRGTPLVRVRVRAPGHPNWLVRSIDSQGFRQELRTRRTVSEISRGVIRAVPFTYGQLEVHRNRVFFVDQ